MEIKSMPIFSFLEGLVSLGLILFGNSVGALRVDYYAKSCPAAEAIVKQTVSTAMQNDPTVSAGLLRMHFHDCFVQGCDGSVLLDSTNGNKAEKDAIPNQSLHGFDVIDKAKHDIESQCKGVVSCADILAMAARDAVNLAGGPYYDVPKGRRDGSVSREQDTIALPSPLLNASGLIQIFGQLGFTAQEMVALSGGHTLGVASCLAFKNRLSGFSSSSNIDPSLNSFWELVLRNTCAKGDKYTTPFDWTRSSFDNAYFKTLRIGGLLTSDQTLYADARTREFVTAYAASEDAFFRDFAGSMVKMGGLNVKEGSNGQIRLDCRRVNY